MTGEDMVFLGKINEYELLKIYEDAARDYEVNSGGRTDYVNEDIHLNYVNTYHCESNLPVRRKLMIFRKIDFQYTSAQRHGRRSRING